MVTASVLLAMNLVLAVCVALLARSAISTPARQRTVPMGWSPVPVTGDGQEALQPSEAVAAPGAAAPPMAGAVDAAFVREREAFNRLKPELMRTHRGKYVAVYRGEVAVIGNSGTEVAEEAYAKLGYVPLYVGLVEERLPVVRGPSPRVEEAGREM